MPILGFDTMNATPRTGFTPSTQDQAQATNIAVTSDHNPLTVAAGVTGLGAVDLADTLASSVPGLSNALGQQRGDLDRKFLSSIDSPGLSAFYQNYKGGIEASSAVMGTVAADLVARRFTAPAGAFMGLVKTLPYARRLAALDDAYAGAMATVRAADMNLAARGALGVEQYVGRSSIEFAGAFDGAEGVKTSLSLARNKAVFNAKALGFGVGARNAAVTEGIMAATLNQNEFLYDDSASHNMMWMAAGVVGGGAMDWLHGAYAIRKFVNSDEVKRAFAGALDPFEHEGDRLLWNKLGLKGEENTSFLAGALSDRLTNLEVGATSLTSAPVESMEGAVALKSNRDALATKQHDQANDILQMIARKGTASDGYTRFGYGSAGYWNHAQMLLKRDPAAMYGVESLGGVADDTSALTLHEKHMNRLQDRIDQAEEKLGAHFDDDGNMAEGSDPAAFAFLQGHIRRLEFESTLTPMAVVDGEFMPLSEAEKFSGYQEPKVSQLIPSEPKLDASGNPFKAQDRHGLFSVESENPGAKVSLDTGFIYHIPTLGKKSLDAADQFAVMNLYRLGDKALDHMAAFTGAIPLPKNPDWFQLDMAEELLRRTDGRAKVVFPDGMTRDSARTEAMIQKAKGIQQWDKAEGRSAMKADEKGQTYEGKLSMLRLKYNLPKLSAYERGVLGNEAEHPVEQLLRGMAQMPADEIRTMSLRDMQESMAQFKRIGDVAPVQPSDIEDLGKSFKFMKDEAGNPVKPLLAYKRPFQTAEWTQEHTAERMAAAKMYTVEKMTAVDAAPITRGITSNIMASPEFDAAAQTHQLMDNQIQGGLTGSAPQSAAGGIGKATITRDWRDRDNLTMLAATRLRENVERMVRDSMKSTVEGAFQGSLSLLANPRNASSKLLLSQFHTYRPGWDIGEDAVKKADGMYGFWLRPTEDNATRYMQQFGREMNPKGELLRAPNDKEVVLDELGMGLQKSFNQVTESIRGEKNTLLRANGRGEIDSVPWYVPPQNTDGKFIGFTFGPDGKTIPGMTVVADTVPEYNRARDLVFKQIEEKGLGYTFRSQDQIKDFASLWDKVQMDFINPGMTPVQPGKSGSGKLVGQQVRTEAFADSLKYLTDSFQRHGNDIIESLLKEQINSAKARAAVSSELTASGGRGMKKPDQNIYQMYLDNLMGRSPGAQQGAVADTIDRLLADATPGVHAVYDAVGRFLQPVNPWARDPQTKKDFATLSEKLGKYMPFEDANDMIERQGLGAVPLTTKKMAAKLNAFSAAVVLRMFEFVHPVMNLSGIINAAPAVVRNMTPMAGENAEAFASRVGHIATIFDLGDGSQLAVPDMVKMTGRAFKRAWARESEPDYKYMVERGYLSQEVAEFHRQFGAIDTPSKHAEFFHNTVDKLSTLSDKSEDFSRSWAHMLGLEVADHLGVKTVEARNGFAHDIANKMIANYSPNNRPDMFKGPFGAVAGLFQSFVMNYYERMFRYVETKDYKSLVTQMASQASLFGMSSVPGWQQFNSMMTDSRGDGDPTSAINRRFGGNAGDLISHGIISNIPKMFGAPGVDLYSRGDVSIRQLQVQNMDSIGGIINSTIPSANVAGKAASMVYGAITGAVNAFRGVNPDLSSTRIGEVLANAIANRPLSGWVEQALAHGNKTDGSGQLVSRTGHGSLVDNVMAKDFQGAMESAYRLLGVRSMQDSNQINAYYANKNAMTHQAALKEQLTQYTRSMIRDGDMTKIPQVFNQYIEQGGDPRYFRRWMKATYISATETRSARQLESAMKSPEHMDQVLRLLDAGVTPTQDDAVGDMNQRYVSNEQSSSVNDNTSMTQGADFYGN